MKKLDDLLAFDPVAEAEKLAKENLISKEEVDGMALALVQHNMAAKTKILNDLKDTTFNTSLSDYQRIIENYGFEKVLQDEFKNRHYPEINEDYFIYAHREKGLLLAFDTWSVMKERKINGGSVYYNWKPEVDNWFECISSGGFISDDVWAGNHDCREALIYNLNRLNNRGQFVVPWVAPQFLYLKHYGEENEDFEKVNKERISCLPIWVREFIREE